MIPTKKSCIESLRRKKILFTYAVGVIGLVTSHIQPNKKNENVFNQHLVRTETKGLGKPGNIVSKHGFLGG